MATRNPMKPKLRLATADDATAIRAIYAPFVTDTAITFEYDPPSVETMRQRLEALMQMYPCLVYETSQVTGYAYADALRHKAAYQWAAELTIYLAPSARGRGMGRALYRALFAMLVKQGFVWAYACLTASYTENAAFHRATGFEHIATFQQAGYKHRRWWDIDWRWKPLREMPNAPSPPMPITQLW